MNHLERYLAVLDGRPVDYLPCTPILMQFAAEHISSYYGAFASDYRVLTEANFVCVREFRTSQMSTMSDPYCETQAFGAKIIYGRDTVPRCEEYPLENDLDFKKLLQPDPMKSERMCERQKALKRYRDEVGGQYSILGWVEGPAAEAADLRGVANYFADLMEDEEYICKLMDLCVEVALEFAQAQVNAGADTIGIGDAVASQVSPDVYERMILPREQRLVAGLKAMGAKVRMHICGNITHLLPGLARLGLNVLDVDHMVDLRLTRNTLGPHVALGGNLDPVESVLRSTPEKIRKAVIRAYEQAGNPFIVNAGCEIPSGTPVDNLKALCTPVAYKS